MSTLPFRVQVVSCDEARLLFRLDVLLVDTQTPLLSFPFNSYSITQTAHIIMRQLQNYGSNALNRLGIQPTLYFPTVYQKFFQEYGITIKGLTKTLNAAFYEYLMTNLQHLIPILKIRAASSYRKGSAVRRYNMNKLASITTDTNNYLLNLYNTERPKYRKVAELYYAGLADSLQQYNMPVVVTSLPFEEYLGLDKITHYLIFVQLTRRIDADRARKLICLSNLYTKTSFTLIVSIFRRNYSDKLLQLLLDEHDIYYKMFGYNYSRQQLFLTWFFKQPADYYSLAQYIAIFNLQSPDLSRSLSRYNCSFR
jgi:hypothetical protein